MTAYQRRSAHEDEAGVTLVELLVVIVVAGVVLTAVAGTVVGLQRATLLSDQQLNDASAGRDVEALVSQDLRTAVRPGGLSVTDPAFVSADVDQVQFYAARGGANGPDLVTFDITGNVLQRTRVPADPTSTFGTWTYTASPAETRLLTDGLQSNALFRFYYYDVLDLVGGEPRQDDGSVLDADGDGDNDCASASEPIRADGGGQIVQAECELYPGPGGLTATERGRIQAVEVLLPIMNTRGNDYVDAAPLEFRSKVRIADSFYKRGG